jgi:adhesin transport system outer membrane protein
VSGVGSLTSEARAISLEDAVRLTVTSNPEIGAASGNRDAILQELRQARGLWLPRVDLELGIGPEATTRPALRQDSVDGDWEEEIRKESSIVIRQRLFDGYEADSETARQKARLEAASRRVAERSEFLGLDTANAYLEILRLQELLALAQQNIEVHQRILGQIRERVQGGAGTESDVTQTETRLSQARVTYAETLQRLEDTEATFARLVGQVPHSLTLPSFNMAYFPKSVGEALELVSRRNPTLQIFEADVETAEAEVELAESEFYPELFVEARSSLNDDINGVSGWESQHSVMLKLQWNLYSGGIDSAARQEALERLNEAKMTRYSTHLNAREEMERSWNFYRSARSRRQNLEGAVRTAQSTRDGYIEQFSVGQRTLLDVLDSENELFNVRSQLASAENNELFAKYRIIALTGDLLKALGIALPAQADGTPPSFNEQVFE